MGLANNLQIGLMTVSKEDLMPRESAARNLLKLSPEDEANLAGLHYTQLHGPGYTRRKAGHSFCYLDSKGRVVKCPKLKKRFQELVIRFL